MSASFGRPPLPSGFMLGVGYNAIPDFSGVQVSLGIGWLFGAGYPSP